MFFVLAHFETDPRSGRKGRKGETNGKEKWERLDQREETRQKELTAIMIMKKAGGCPRIIMGLLSRTSS